MNSDNNARREQTAFDAIQQSLGTEAGEYGATLFATHHIEELEPSYWQTHLGVDTPTPAQVLGLLCVLAPPSDDSGNSLDFGLPGDISNYLLCVSFGDDGGIEDISMES